MHLSTHLVHGLETFGVLFFLEGCFILEHADLVLGQSGFILGALKLSLQSTQVLGVSCKIILDQKLVSLISEESIKDLFSPSFEQFTLLLLTLRI